NSTVRKIMLPNSDSRFSGIIAWRGLVDMDKLSNKTQSLSSTVWMGKNSHFVHYPIEKNKFLNFIGTLKKDKWENNSWHETGDRQELKSDFKGWNATVNEIIDNTDVIYKWGLFENESLPNWISKRAVIIGDAAHPMSPSYGQGANTAMEDAIILYRSILCFSFIYISV
ncbi:FAD-dependent monooxygenase, partial [bacterium]|nr:FAD-dependent monooxygenase [bacterium]